MKGTCCQRGGKGDVSEREGVRGKVHVCVCGGKHCAVCVCEREGKERGGRSLTSVRALPPPPLCRGFFLFLSVLASWCGGMQNERKRNRSLTYAVSVCCRFCACFFFSLSLSLPTARVSLRVCSENVRTNLDASLSPILYYM